MVDGVQDLEDFRALAETVKDPATSDIEYDPLPSNLYVDPPSVEEVDQHRCHFYDRGPLIDIAAGQFWIRPEFISVQPSGSGISKDHYNKEVPWTTTVQGLYSLYRLDHNGRDVDAATLDGMSNHLAYRARTGDGYDISPYLPEFLEEREIRRGVHVPDDDWEWAQERGIEQEDMKIAEYARQADATVITTDSHMVEIRNGRDRYSDLAVMAPDTAADRFTTLARQHCGEL